ncbi:hypothetical protein DEI92_10950 [Curtobacterium sp. MCBD17_034]|nr:hypothetical protein DEI92_10950 [Curtobacterium sp. MCBD17_034]PZM34680.1 hypothetical protein DEI90_07520 [Curtobacterium sp. MCBD17_031]
MAGVTPIVTSSPASTLKPTKPTRAPTAETGFVLWADIGCSLDDAPDRPADKEPHAPLGVPHHPVDHPQHDGDPEQLRPGRLGAGAGGAGSRGRARGVPQASAGVGVNVDARLAELGITLPEVAAPVASYVPAVVAQGFVYTSGQLPFVDGALPVSGKVGAQVTADVARDQARQCALNALAAARAAIGSLDRVARVLKVTGFVASDPSFTGQPGVVNGASDLLGAVFGDVGVHARSAVGVAVLPLDAPVEIELVLELTA